MTIDQAREIYRAFFVCFPYAKQFLDKCEQAEDTYREWCGMLRTVEYDAALEAVHRMKDGRLEVPDKPWEMGMLPLKIRSYAGRIMDDARKQSAREMNHREAVVRRTNADNHRYNPGTIGRLVLISGRRARDGQISHDQHERNVERLRRKIHEKRSAGEDSYSPITLEDVAGG